MSMMKKSLVLVLSVWLTMGRGQETNLTLFEISPCGNPTTETISRFKSDIYAVMPDLSQCPNISQAESIGLRVISWANVTSNEYKNGQPPVTFVTRQENSGVAGILSWNIPLKPHGFTKYFQHVNRTMCPKNVSELEIEIQESVTLPLDETQFLLYIDVFSSSIHPVKYSLKIEIVPHFIIKLNEPLSTVVAAASPQIYYFKFPSNSRAVTVEASTDSDKCAYVSVQNNTCPVNDLVENARSRGIYQTMSKSAFLTVEDDKVLDREFMLVIITANYSHCHSPKYREMLYIRSANTTGINELPFEQNITVIIRNQEPTSKFVLAILFPFIVFAVYLILVAIYLFLLPRIYFQIKCSREKKCSESNCRWKLPWSNKFPLSRSRMPSYSTLMHDPGASIQSSPLKNEGSTESSGGGRENGSSTETGSSTLSDSIRSVVYETDESKLMLPRMCKVPYTKLNRQYRVYSWNTITVGIFYALPAFQLVLSEQRTLNSSGDQDRCYYNFKCTHPLGALTAFNAVWSNVGYFLLGFLFIGLTLCKNYFYWRRRKDDKEYIDSHGIPQFFGIYIAMGVALILEGFMSAFYHICPTNANFQFDTAFMFIIGGLFLVKILQNRHPDINANAFVAFFSFAVIIFLTLIGIYLDQMSPVVIRLLLFGGVIILVVLFFLSFYRFHEWDFEAIRGECKNIKEFFTTCPKHKCRFIKLCFAFIVNLALALFVIIGHKNINVATAILGFFVINLMLFLLYYIIQKLLFCETFTALPVFLLLALGAMWAAAFYFFLFLPVSNWEETPAESRAMNQYCALLGFYDYHDIWHFLSAGAMFLSFLFLLTLDDGIMDMDRKEIHIF